MCASSICLIYWGRVVSSVPPHLKQGREIVCGVGMVAVRPPLSGPLWLSESAARPEHARPSRILHMRPSCPAFAHPHRPRALTDL